MKALICRAVALRATVAPSNTSCSGISSTKGPLRNNAFVIERFDGVVPIAVELVSDEIDGIEVGVADDQALGV